MKKSRVTALVAGIALAVFNPSLARDAKSDNVPRGIELKDFDAMEVRITRSGSSAKVKGRCTSKNPGHRPISTARIYVNGEYAKGLDAFGLEVTATHFITGKGRYLVILQCENELAEQESAAMFITGTDVVIVND